MDPRTDTPSPLSAPVPVEEIMARLANGDQAAIFTLAEHHGARIAAAVRRELTRCGVNRVAGDDLRSLVIESCIAIASVARSWKPGGALPWVWASGRILGVVKEFVGVHADALDLAGEAFHAADAVVASTVDEPLAVTLARLVDREPIVGLFVEACDMARLQPESVCRLLEYRIQQDQGDPSPSRTLANRYGLLPQTLRKRISRDRHRLRQVVSADPRFAQLADLELVA